MQRFVLYAVSWDVPYVWTVVSRSEYLLSNSDYFLRLFVAEAFG